MSKELTVEATAKLLQNVKSIILASHIGPDGDTLGSTLALAEGLKQLGKNVQIMVDDKISFTYSFMPGITDYIFPQAGDKYEADLLVIIDASSLDRIGLVDECVEAKQVLNIDHHISNTRYAEYLLLNSMAAAVGEMMYVLLTEMQVKITPYIATNLYVAIATDSGYFKYSNTTPQTMRLAAELLELGVKPNDVSDCLEVKSQATINLLKVVLNTLTFYAEGKIATIEIDHEYYDKDVDTDSFIYYPRYIYGVDVAACLKAVEPDVTRVSMRAKSVDVSKIALSFNGGGHKKAAGCTINAPLAEAKAQLLKAVEKEMHSTND